MSIVSFDITASMRLSLLLFCHTEKKMEAHSESEMRRRLRLSLSSGPDSKCSPLTGFKSSFLLPKVRVPTGFIHTFIWQIFIRHVPCSRLYARD